MLCVWVRGCDPGRASDGSRLALHQTISIECLSIFFMACALCYYSFLFVIFLVFVLFLFCFRVGAYVELGLKPGER